MKQPVNDNGPIVRHGRSELGDMVFAMCHELNQAYAAILRMEPPPIKPVEQDNG